MRTAKHRLPETAVGRHLLADLHQIEPERLRDERALVELLLRALKSAGFTVLAVNSHKFEQGGGGVTAMAMLSESHATIHTYPEHGYLALDVFSCGSLNPYDVLETLVASLRPGMHCRSIHSRGATL